MSMPIYGQINDARNIKLLQATLDEEKRFNDPSIAYNWVGQRYKENKDRYGRYLYEAEKELKFIDVDVFRQPALYFKEQGKYNPFHPDYDKSSYNRYWDLIEYRRRNGMTAWAGLDLEGKPRLVHCPGKLYGFLNFAPINRVKDDDDAIDNEKSFEDNESTDDLAEFKLEELIRSLNIRDTRTAKKTIDFPSFFDGQYHLSIKANFARLVGKNDFYGKARRKGSSYLKAWEQTDNIDLNPYISCILAAYDKKYLIQGKGLMKMVYTYADFLNKYTDFSKKRLVNNKEHLKFGYTLSGQPEEYGYLSEILAVSAMNNPDVTIGKDVFELNYEELGKFPNFKESFEVTTSTAEAGDYKTGFIAGWGTGGTDDANWAGFEDAYYNPAAYDALECNNIWDDGREGTPCGYFYPHVQALEGHMDYNGNTNYDSAWASFIAKKEIKRASTSDENAFEKWCGQRANCGLEAFAKSATNIFPREVIRVQLSLCEHNEKAKYLARNGVLVPTEKGVKLITNEEIRMSGGKVHPPVVDYPLTANTDVHGCFVEWIPPYRDPHTGKVPEGLYFAAQDPYAHDKDLKNLSIKDSLGVTFWIENVNNITPHGGGIPVAAYVGRPPRMDDYNEQVRLGLAYYGAEEGGCKLMFENDRGDTKTFMQIRRLLHWLFEEPEMQFAKDLEGKTGRGYGMHMTDKRKAKAAIYLRDFLNTPVTKGENAKVVLNYIFDPGFLRELLRWNMQGNFDRVSAWLIAMFAMKELETKEINPPKATKSNSLFNRPHC